MCGECNYHLKELYVAINALFSKISASCELSFTLTTHTCRQVKPITAESTLGEQIKYYRSIDDIKQTDLGVKLNFHRSTINHLENRDMKLVNVELIKGIDTYTKNRNVKLTTYAAKCAENATIT